MTFLGNEDRPMRVGAAKAVADAGFTPVPHVAARRMASTAEFAEFLDALRSEVGSTLLFAVAGDPAEPMGPYASSLDLIRSGLPAEHGFTEVSIAGYPSSTSPPVSTASLRSNLKGNNVRVSLIRECHPVALPRPPGGSPRRPGHR